MRMWAAQKKKSGKNLEKELSPQVCPALNSTEQNTKTGRRRKGTDRNREKEARGNADSESKREVQDDTLSAAGSDQDLLSELEKDLAVSVTAVLKVMIIESKCVSSLFMVVRGVNFLPIIAWKASNTLGF